MSKLRIANGVLALGLMTGVASAAETPASPHPYFKNTVSATIATGCDKLVGKNCEGRNARLEWRFAPRSGFGSLRVGVENYHENMGYIFFTRRFDKSYGKAHMDMDWSVQAQGTRLTLDQAFRLGRNGNAEIGVYVGHVKAKIGANASAGITIHPDEITIPALALGDFTTDPYTFRFKGYSAQNDASWSKSGASKDAGLRGALGWSMPVSAKIRTGVSGFGEINPLRTSYGAGVGVYYSSSPDHKLGTQAGGGCKGSPLTSSAKYAFSLNACVEKLQRHALLDTEMRYSNRIAARLSDEMVKVNRALEEVAEEVEWVGRYRVRDNYTGTQVAEFFGFESDYKKPVPSLVLSAFARVSANSSVSVAVQHSQVDTKVGLTYGYSY